MKLRCLFVPLGVDSTPIGQRKQLEALSAVGSALGGLFNLFGQESANKANREMTEQTNKMNYQIASEVNQLSQQQFNQNMRWLREQYYDTDQYKRLVEASRKAGLNPALALGSVSPVGSVGQSSPTSFHAAQMDAGHVEPLTFGDGLSESIGHAVDAYYNNQLRQAETEKVSYDAQISRANAATQMRKNVAELRSMRLDNEQRMKNLKRSDKEYERLELENEQIDWSIKRMLTDWDETSKQLRYGNQLLQKQNENADAVTTGVKLDNALKRVELSFKPTLLSLGVKMSQSQIDLFLKQAALVAEQTHTEFENGQIANKKDFEQTLRNRLLEMEYSNKQFKDAVRNSSKGSRIVYWYADYFSDIIFGGVGKILK